ncbi:helix-turn-helix transcriptional regulator [Phenylobacterium sp.]|uniref:helix-turn-helix transcriptional regulator n=1 Tax=Phenylobacterium sp. TaxID=1871053 RepID=UPI0035ADBA1D
MGAAPALEKAHIDSVRCDRTQHQLRIERLPEVLNRTGLSRSSLYAALKKGAFPKAVRLGPRAIGFVSSEVSAWIVARAAER